MIRLLGRRVAASLLLIFLVLTLTFFLVRLAPGDPLVDLENSGHLNREQIEKQRRLYGLDKPLVVQYGLWLRGIARGDWGTSIVYQKPATAVVAEALPYTLLLGVVILILQYGFGLLLGVGAAQRPGSARDHSIRTVSLVLYSIPVFWLGLMAILVFHLFWGLLPPGGVSSIGGERLSPAGRVVDVLRHLILPAGVLALVNAGRVARFVRNNLLEVLGADYIRTARAKGLSRRRVIWLHALRNSLVSIVQLFGLSVPALLNGILVIEVVFAWPGLGRVMFNACLGRDYPVVVAITAFSAALVIVGNLLADLLHSAVDPRIRHG